MPKINTDIFAIRVKDTNLIKLYDIKMRRVTRKLLLTGEDVHFGAADKGGEYTGEHLQASDDDDVNSENRGDHDQDLIGKEYQAEQIKMRLALQLKKRMGAVQ